MRRREHVRIARVESLAADLLDREHLFERHRVQLAQQRFVERRPLLAVEHGVVGEIRRRVREIGRDQLDERRFRHRLQRVIRPPLFTDRRDRLLAQGLSAERPRPMRRVHQA